MNEFIELVNAMRKAQKHYNLFGTSECLKLSHCPLFLGYVFKKSKKVLKDEGII